ncbi:hypothetical protein IGI04_029773 [Brassica rapa subsp. trilocularis]|uniref:Uncharacterized protein n=1 Tax=Brassica rapa subsp. trilocularis TaxID=1813537 RepID=A0ABQ7LNS5_BRACM|nr:hypothetical protein IGI04_029773 [Brassica rapa subsp. trilocularis]
MFSGLLTPAERTQSVMVETTVNPKIFGVNAKYLEQPMQLDWPFDSGRKKTYLSQERGQRTPKYSDRLWKKKVESWCKAVERTFDRILETRG